MMCVIFLNTGEYFYVVHFLISQQQTIYLPSLPLVIFVMRQFDLCIGFWSLWLTDDRSFTLFFLCSSTRWQKKIVLLYIAMDVLITFVFFLKKLLKQKKDVLYTWWFFFMIIFISQPCNSQFLIFLTRIIELCHVRV